MSSTRLRLRLLRLVSRRVAPFGLPLWLEAQLAAAAIGLFLAHLTKSSASSHVRKDFCKTPLTPCAPCLPESRVPSVRSSEYDGWRDSQGKGCFVRCAAAMQTMCGGMHRCRRLRGVLDSFGPAREDAGRRAADQRVEFRLLLRGHSVQGASTAAERSSLSSPQLLRNEAESPAFPVS